MDGDQQLENTVTQQASTDFLHQDQTSSRHDQPLDARYTFEFNGRAGEYFRIWIVNLLLTIVTLGFYSPWAKVRDQRYINASTALAGSSFEYTADPKRILLGRIIALISFGVYQGIATFYPTFGFLALAVIICFIPAAIVLSMQFRHRNTVWRGIRFSFAGNFKHAYQIFSPAIVFAAFLAIIPFVFDVSDFMNVPDQGQEYCLDDEPASEQDAPDNSESGTCNNPQAEEIWTQEFQWLMYGFGTLYFIGLIAFPWWQTRYYQFLARNSRFGESHFDFATSSWHFYKMYLVAMAVIFAGSILGSIIPPIQFLLIFAAFIFANAYITTTRLNILYTELSIEGVHFESTLSTYKMLWLYLSNTVAILLSLGLLIPWARIRTLRYRASETRVYSVELNNFVNRTTQDRNAIGEELGEVFGLEIGI